MRSFLLIALVPALCVSPALLSAQVATPAATASSMLSPALGTLRQSLAAVHLDKWKAPGGVREEANSNIASITRDLDGTLPGLLATADAAPGVVSQNLPVFRNVDALYDVLLRVVETADLSAPDTDTDRLHTALSTLEDARRNFGDLLQGAAVAQEQQLASTTAQLRAQAAVSAPRAAVAPTMVTDGDKTTATATHKKKAVKPKPAAPKPTTPPAQ
ncbi:hypothetical protein [Acidipila sp. EB88]|uniref:hypothetical protein n=1 Tax=Acidipila sp. EB88 TaxID=2305226 RepID=UPI000F5DF5D5|nr:hypothetical protein [Acidipila sp. EB88]